MIKTVIYRITPENYVYNYSEFLTWDEFVNELSDLIGYEGIENININIRSIELEEDIGIFPRWVR